MKKTLLLTAAILLSALFTSCSPYLIDRFFDVTGDYKVLKKKDMPDFDSKHNWSEKSRKETVEIWKSYPSVEKVSYTALDFYEHDCSGDREYYSKWEKCPVEKQKKSGYYENLPWDTIYYSTPSTVQYELNAESPETVADGVKIFVAEDDASFTKFVFDSSVEKGLRIYQNGWLVYEDYFHYYDEPSDGKDGYRVHSAIVYKK